MAQRADHSASSPLRNLHGAGAAAAARGEAIDLTCFSERTRRALYEAVAAVQFAPADPAEECWCSYTAEQAGLQVWHCWARWFAAWVYLEEVLSDVPADQVLAMVLITADPSQRFGISLTGI
ncbi:MAG TPA: hypothetical protein VHR45_22850 [Thermoanaerobaculia bacterium]|nr:hypothetical protein [Thermoanaerobaculia bacterium]